MYLYSVTVQGTIFQIKPTKFGKRLIFSGDQNDRIEIPYTGVDMGSFADNVFGCG
jgi:hypothetical protein